MKHPSGGSMVPGQATNNGLPHQPPPHGYPAPLPAAHGHSGYYPPSHTPITPPTLATMLLFLLLAIYTNLISLKHLFNKHSQMDLSPATVILILSIGKADSISLKISVLHLIMIQRMPLTEAAEFSPVNGLYRVVVRMRCCPAFVRSRGISGCSVDIFRPFSSTILNGEGGKQQMYCSVLGSVFSVVVRDERKRFCLVQSRDNGLVSRCYLVVISLLSL